MRTETTESANKHLVSFNEVDFLKALEQFKSFENIKVELEKALIAFSKDIEYNGSIEIDFLNPKATLQNIVLEAFKEKNSLSLSYEKLVEILELPIHNVNYLISELEKCKVLETPEARDYSQYATTIEQKERLRYSNSMVRIFESYKESSYGNIYPGTVIKAFTKPPVYVDTRMNWKVNPYFVYDTFR